MMIIGNSSGPGTSTAALSGNHLGALLCWGAATRLPTAPPNLTPSADADTIATQHLHLIPI